MRQADLLAGHDGVGCYSQERNDRLWLAIPEGLRAPRLTLHTIPAEYLGAFVQHDPDDSRAVNFTGLPEPMSRELSFGLWRMIETGYKIFSGMQNLVANCLRTALEDPRRSTRQSLMDAPCEVWYRDLLAADAVRNDRLPGTSRRALLGQLLRRTYRFVWFAYDDRPWWQHELWSLKHDPRIPRREREPQGNLCLYFDSYANRWLRVGTQWFLMRGLESGRITWSTARAYYAGLRRFDRFATMRAVPGPWLCDEPRDVRPLMLDYTAWVRGLRSDRAERAGKPLSKTRVARLMTDVEQFYGYMTDHREEAARALAEPGWLRLGGAHARFWHFGEKPRAAAVVDEAKIIDDATLRAIMKNVHRLGDPKSEGGLDDEQAMRIFMLAATTARRINEILMIDFDPLLPLASATEGFVAKLRYGQTKIEGAPDTILVDADTVAVIRAQQEWGRRRARELGLERDPKYLFLATHSNRNCDRHYPLPTLNARLGAFGRLLDLRDSVGRPVQLTRTHWLRHTKATSLMNAGVPLSVIQRYLGHLSPSMTMRYAQVTDTTMEREFVRFRKISADATEIDIAPEDLYDLLQLDQRADRILPNGWCLLPPRQTCNRGNACLTCDKFATDATHLDDHEHQLDLLGNLINSRKTAFEARTGREMEDTNVWLAERLKERHALELIIVKLHDPSSAGAAGQAVRGAGTPARGTA